MASSLQLMSDRSRVEQATTWASWMMFKLSIFTIRQSRLLRTMLYLMWLWRLMKWSCLIRSLNHKKHWKMNRLKCARSTLSKCQMNVGKWRRIRKRFGRNLVVSCSTMCTVSWFTIGQWIRQMRANCSRILKIWSKMIKGCWLRSLSWMELSSGRLCWKTRQSCQNDRTFILKS